MIVGKATQAVGLHARGIPHRAVCTQGPDYLAVMGCDIAYDVSRLVRQRMCIAAGDRRRQGLPGVLCPALRIGAVYGCVTDGIASYPYRIDGVAVDARGRREGSRRWRANADCLDGASAKKNLSLYLTVYRLSNTNESERTVELIPHSLPVEEYKE
ncbi:hypothetical protein, conserved [Eimeria brunetti]|uniref:Uncharacterized protein n=1 Tax=Eimeria brunetti TaxID=51314 RepID=U6LI47_9EIME|nr:hypothetical protein, conserved [Eimeria brunetti]